MPKRDELPVLKPKKVIEALERAGFEARSGSGDHVVMEHAEADRRATITHRKGYDVPPWLLKKILRDAGIELSDFIMLLNRKDKAAKAQRKNNQTPICVSVKPGSAGAGKHSNQTDDQRT